MSPFQNLPIWRDAIKTRPESLSRGFVPGQSWGGLPKCQWLGKRILVEVTGQVIRHLPRLQQLCCQECGHRVLDYYVVYGDANVDVK